MQKFFVKERIRKVLKKWTSSKISKIMGTQMPPKKEKERKMNKIAHVFLHKCFQVSNKRDMCQEA
jgi:hypothetical protein